MRNYWLRRNDVLRLPCGFTPDMGRVVYGPVKRKELPLLKTYWAECHRAGLIGGADYQTVTGIVGGAEEI